MNDYWETTSNAELIAHRLEVLADRLQRLIEILEQRWQATGPKSD
jgi:hypothetical protein